MIRFEDLLGKVRSYSPDGDLELLRKAYVFSALAHKWWDPTGDFKPLHDINPLRLGYIDGHAELAGKTVLDVGCGGGILSESMAKHGAAEVTGIDMAENADTIAAMGDLGSSKAKEEIDAKGMAVAPGFSNMMGHSEETLFEDSRALSDVKQGVTMEVFGESSFAPLRRREVSWRPL